ncbi:MAG: hypothetical protein ACRENI_03145 [Gemmatimonadaceae bacterium]
MILLDSNIPMYLRAPSIRTRQRRGASRDAIHAAITERERIVRIMSFDGGFDGLPGITRLWK